MGNCLRTKELNRRATVISKVNRPVTKKKDEIEKDIPFHRVTQTHHYTVRYPDHPPRKETATYRKAHKALCIDDENAHCFICSVTKNRGSEANHFVEEKTEVNSMLSLDGGGKTKPPLDGGGKGRPPLDGGGKTKPPLESHHFYCEKAAELAIDWIKFGKIAKNLHHIVTGVCIGDQFDWEEVAKNPEIFVDSVHNMIVLCKEHHIGAKGGIHHLPFPVWILQMAPKDGFTFIE